MADQIALSAEPRPGSGKGEARTLRAQGRVPAVAYGSKLSSTSIHVDAKELRAALSTDAGENAVIRLAVGGDTHLTMPREIHRHPVRRDVLHLDFVAFDRDQKVTVEVPLHVLGEGPEGAIVSQPMNVLTIDVLPLEVPDYVETSIEGLEVGDVIRAGDISLPDGVDLHDDPERTAVSITLPDLEPVEETAEEAVEEALAGEDAGEGGETAEGGDEAEGE
ncbi:50S ribosomal protein L25 [Euzebya sp.]|uniref:50S ribosomal protein L25 n=1 Tax=Euzebya sp. TaxID=1971409 RepID=UPI00351125EC